MDKILVDIHVPAINKNYDVYIPFKSKFYDVVKMVTCIVEEISDGNFIASEETVLCNGLTGAIYNINMSAAELGLKNGSKLMLI
jgi:hypothetical protein